MRLCRAGGGTPPNPGDTADSQSPADESMVDADVDADMAVTPGSESVVSGPNVTGLRAALNAPPEIVDLKVHPHNLIHPASSREVYNRTNPGIGPMVQCSGLVMG